MAPEQCDPRSQPDPIGPPADVWGLGATLYHAITGERPFPRAEDSRELGDATVRFPQLVLEPAPRPRACGPVAGLVARTLARDPSVRPPAAEVAEALEPLVPELPARKRRGRQGAKPAR